jgi:hypothetical protein
MIAACMVDTFELPRQMAGHSFIVRESDDARRVDYSVSPRQCAADLADRQNIRRKFRPSACGCVVLPTSRTNWNNRSFPPN